MCAPRSGPVCAGPRSCTWSRVETKQWRHLVWPVYVQSHDVVITVMCGHHGGAWYAMVKCLVVVTVDQTQHQQILSWLWYTDAL